MIFPKLALLILAFAPGGNSKQLEGSDIDCSDKANNEDALCMCRYPQNYNTKTCQQLKAQNGGFFSQIINGEEVDPNVYPWFARSTRGSGWAGCGGSLITPEYVLTAAHCVDGRINQLEINGGYQIGALCAPYGPNSSNNCQQDVQSFGIDKIIPHPSYNKNTLQYDFALVRLDGSSTITPVTIDAGTVSPGYENLDGLKQNLWPIGFGRTVTGSVATKLMHVNVNYVKQSVCNSAYNGDITDDMMCATDENQDACQGDSGGPLYDSDSETLVGVVSWGIGCALAEYPGVYSRISHQIGWIKDEICEPGAHNEPRPDFCAPIGPPTTAPPTPAPTPCSDNELKLTLTTDNYPGETTWTLVNQCTNEQYAGGPFNDQVEEYVEELCIPDGQYTFTINDAYEDGICCSYGEGSYILEYNAIIEKEGGNFGGSESHTFGSCGDPPVAPPVATPTGGDWVPIYEDDFEDGQGLWMGTNKRVNDFSYPDGDWSLRIRRTSLINSEWIDIGDYSQLSIKFWMYATGTGAGDNFFFKVRFNGECRKCFSDVDEWKSGTDFSNGEWLEQAMTIDVPAGKKQIQMKFKGDSDHKDDEVFIDQFLLEGNPN